MASYWLRRSGGAVPEGPYSKTRICEMVAAGLVRGDDEVASRQLGPWARVSGVAQLASLMPRGPVEPSTQDLFDDPPAPASQGAAGAAPSSAPRSSRVESAGNGPVYLMPARIVQSVVERLDKIAKGGLFDRLSSSAVPIGHIGLVTGAAFLTLFSVVFAIRLDSLKLALASGGIPIGCAILQYGSWKLLDACGQVVRNTPTRTSSLVLYQFVSILLVASAAAILASGAYFMIENGTEIGRGGFALSTVLALYLLVIGCLLLTPAALNLSVDESCSAGTDGVSIIGTAMKALLAGSRLVFGVLCGLGGLASGIGALWFLFDKTDLRGYPFAIGGATLLVVGAANAVVVYVSSVIYFIVPDLVISVLRHTRERTS